MSTSGFDHYYVETHDWKKAVAFWQRLGFELEPLPAAGPPSNFLA